MQRESNKIIDSFHNLYFVGLPGQDYIFKNTYWMNVPCAKCPLDLWIYQEIMTKVRPDLIIETGTDRGGSALFMAHMMDILNKGQVITIDIEHRQRPAHPRIRYATGSSADSQLIHRLLDDRPDETRMVVLDSDHHKDHVLREMQLLAPYVTRGSYLIVEDSNVNGHPVSPDFGPGPYEAVEEFLRGRSDFVVDSSCEKFLMTFNPRGYLKRIG